MKSKVNSKFKIIGDFSIMKLDGNLIDSVGRLGWKIADEYATLSSNTEARINSQFPLSEIQFGSFFNIRSCHDFEFTKRQRNLFSECST